MNIKSILFFYFNGGVKNFLRLIIGFRLGQFYMFPARRISLSEIDNNKKNIVPSLKLSLVTPVLNQSNYITETIESVLSQNYKFLEYIVMDGGSFDGTYEIIERYKNQLNYYESRKDKGQSDAINRGFKHSTGDIMGWINGDDILLPGAIEYVMNFFEINPEVDVIYGNRILIDTEGKQIGTWVLPSHSDDVLSWVDYIPQETLFWRRRLWNRIGSNVDINYKFAMDWDLLIRFRDAGARFEHIPLLIGGFRIHNLQKTFLHINNIGANEIEKIRFRCLGYIPSKSRIRLAVAKYILRHIVCVWKVRFVSLLTFIRVLNKR